MKKLNLAIIGQGRSGKNIHGVYYLSPANKYYDVKYVVDGDADRRAISEARYPGCKTFADYRELYACEDIDLVVNATYSEQHYGITKALLQHGFHVLVEKPFARTTYECAELINLAKEKGLVLAVFQQTFLAPFYLFARELADSGKLGRILQVDIHYSGFARRWDWQTLQKKCAGSLYNTGPHPVGIALGFLGFDPETRVVFSKLDKALTSGDADDYAKLLLTAPGKPVVDVEICSTDAYSPYNLKICGTLGTFQCTTTDYKMTYIVPGENPEQPVQEKFLQDENRNPIYCSEKLIKHEESGTFDGDAFNSGTASLYEQLYRAITEGKPMDVTPEMAMGVIGVIETAHAQNPMPVLY